jgi:hypothetical protein
MRAFLHVVQVGTGRTPAFRSSGRVRDTPTGEAAGQGGAGSSQRPDCLVTRLGVFSESGWGIRWCDL